MKKSEKNFFEKVLDAVPGLSGYRKREDRRTTDKRLREYLAGRIDNARKKIADLKLDYTNEGRLSELDNLGRLERKLTKIGDSIRFANYGYSGLFDQLKIKEEELDVLYNHDLKFIEAVEKLEKSVSEKGEGLKEIVEEIETLVEERKQIFESPDIEGR
ncbi:MAG: hypothetical protein GYA35_08800 [Thermoanaerobaculaceae bacterium]|nr:hypothetical protein [Thermoanaerobaculaceae bacterium]